MTNEFPNYLQSRLGKHLWTPPGPPSCHFLIYLNPEYTKNHEYIKIMSPKYILSQSLSKIRRDWKTKNWPTEAKRGTPKRRQSNFQYRRILPRLILPHKHSLYYSLSAYSVSYRTFKNRFFVLYTCEYLKCMSEKKNDFINLHEDKGINNIAVMKSRLH